MSASVIDEYNTLIQQEDFSQLSRRLLDLSVEHTLGTELEHGIYELRRAFLNTDHSQALKDKATAIISSLGLLSIDEHASSEYQSVACKATQVSKRFTSGRSPFNLQPVDVTLRFGEITGIVGENGNGKTTLLRILAGELASDTGQIVYPGLHASETDWYKVKNRFVFIPQRIPRWYGTLLDNLRFFASIHGITGEENNRQIEYILFRLGLDKFRDLRWSEISSGYRLRFELAKAMMWRPRVILLDEPLANLDINAQQLFLQDLRFFAHSKRFPLSIILSSQQLHEVESVSDNIIFIKQGKTIYSGQQKDFATDRAHNTFELAGAFKRDDLLLLFAGTEIRIEDSGTNLVVTVPVTLSSEQFLKELLNHSFSLSYFRDISTSTRKLFHRDI
ncbi:MAG: ABC transporter ATP-binding protein [Bacteroidetes bacterium]|nr:ABC transporter ATP-binding protein [Bacteroidota bacterium]